MTFKHMGFFNDVSKTCEEIGIHIPTGNDCTPRSPIPPWDTISNNLNVFATSTVEVLSSLITSNIFRDIVRIDFPAHTMIFTDGSKTQIQVASAYVVPSLDVKQAYILPNECSVLTSELYAIYEALKYIKANQENSPYVIFSYSKSSISLLLTEDSRSYKWIVVVGGL